MEAPHLVELGGELDVVAGHRGARRRGVGRVREEAVEDVAELVEERRQLGRGEQGGPAGTGLGKVEGEGDDREVAGQPGGGHELVHPRASPLRVPRIGVDEDEAEGATADVGDLVGADVVVPADDALRGSEGDPIEPRGGEEDAVREHSVELEVLRDLVGVDAELVLPVLREVVHDVGRGDLVEAVAVADGVELGRQLRIGGRDEGGDDVGCRVGAARRLVVDRVGGVRRVAEQLRLQGPQGSDVRDLRPGVAVPAACTARHRVPQHVLPRRGALERSEDELLSEVVQSQQVAGFVAFARAGGCGRDLVLTQPLELVRLAEMDREFPCVRSQCPGEGGRERGEFGFDRRHVRTVLLAEAGAGPDEVLDRELLVALVLGVEVGDRDLFDAVEEIDAQQHLGAGRGQPDPHLGDGIGELRGEVVRFEGADEGGEPGHRHGRGFEADGRGDEGRVGVVGDDVLDLGEGEVGGGPGRGAEGVRGDRGEVREGEVALWVEECLPDIDGCWFGTHRRRTTFLTIFSHDASDPNVWRPPGAWLLARLGRMSSASFPVTNAFRVGFVGTLGVGLAIALITALQSVGTVLIYIGLALFLALGLDPIIQWLVARKVSRTLAVILVVVAFIGVVVGVVLLIAPAVISQIQQFIADLPQIVSRLQTTEWVADLERRFTGAVDLDSIFASVSSWVSDPKNVLSLGGGVVSIGAGILSFITGVIIVVILTIYFAVTLPTIKSAMLSLVAASSRDTVDSVSEEITRSVGRYVLGQVSLGIINGVCSAIFLTIIGAPLPALLAFVAFLASLIPLIGPISGAIVITASCLMVSPGLGIAAGIYYLVYMQIEAYLLSPRIMNAAVAVPGALVIIAAIAGGTLGGVLGAVVAVPVAASFLIIIRKVIIPAQDKK
ncbi:transmembrane protein [Mycobacteroides abscessus subsp. abscessus]|nr:transmembrane protein [Mycobacteroides abscessus subsp. abscessus]